MQAVVRLRESGMSYTQIAQATGSSKGRIGTICRQFNLGTDSANQHKDLSDVDQLLQSIGLERIGKYTNNKVPFAIRCKRCGSVFKRKYNSLQQRHSGCPSCAERHFEELQKQKREAQLQKEADRLRMKAERDSRETNRSLAKRLANHVCKTCGRTYCIELTGYNSTTYCSEMCQTSYYRRKHDQQRYRKMYSKRHDNDITLRKLFDRDNGVCYLCNKPCDWNDCQRSESTFIAGPTYPSIDHVVPLAKGGLHVWDNVRLCCRECNSKKGMK